MFQCPVCHKLIPEADEKKCPFCKTDNTEWRKLKLRDHFLKFPWFVWVLVVILILAQLVFSVRGPLRSWFPEDTRALPNLSILVAIVSVVIVFAVFFLRKELRFYELIRPYRLKQRRPGLITLAVLSLATAMLLSAGAMVTLWLLFSAAPKPRWSLILQDVKSGTSSTILDNYGRVSSPSWAPDGNTLLFASDKDGDWDVYLASVQGMAIRNLTQNTYADYAPSWANQGTQILYTSDKNGDPEIFIMDGDGQEIRPLTKTPGKAVVGNWSPTEESFVFVASSAGYMPPFYDPVQVGNMLTPLLILLYGLAFPCLILAIMLIGERSYITALGEKYPLPVFTDTNQLADVAAIEAVDHVDGFTIQPREYPGATGSTPPQESPSPSGRFWSVHHNIPDKPIEKLSLKRTDRGGLDMIVHIQESATVEEGGEVLRPEVERRYAIVADEWGSILSCEQVNDRSKKTAGKN